MEIYHEKFGIGKLVNSTEKLDESDMIIAGDVFFEHGIELDLPLFEVTYSAKDAAAGKDIGKPGKEFKNIAAKAAAKYGSKAAGGRVAGAILKNLRSEEVKDNTVQIQGTESPIIASKASNPYKNGHLPKDLAKNGIRGQESYGKGLGKTKNTPYVKPFDNENGEHAGWKAMNKHGKTKWFRPEFKNSAKKHAGITEEIEELDEKLVGNQKKIDANKNAKKQMKESVEVTPRVTPDTANSRMPAVENIAREIMSQNRNLRKEAKIAEFNSRNK